MTVPVLAFREPARERDHVIGVTARATAAVCPSPGSIYSRPPGDQVGPPFHRRPGGGHAVADAPGSESIPAQIISILLTLTYTIDCRASPGLPPGWLFLDGLTVRAGAPPAWFFLRGLTVRAAATPLRSARYSGSWALDAIINYSNNDVEYLYFYSIYIFI